VNSHVPISLSWVLFLFALAAGVSAGYLAGGRLSRLRIPSTIVFGALLAFAVQIGLAWLPARWFGLGARYGLLIATYAAFFLTLVVASVRLRGRLPGLPGIVAIGLVFAGWALNTAPIVANAGMPVPRSALVAAGYAPDQNPSRLGREWKHVLTTGKSELAGLGDTVAVQPLHAVYSIGDFLLLAGIAAMVAAGMRGEFDARPGPADYRLGIVV